MKGKFNICVIVPSLAKKGPVIVAMDIAKNLSKKFNVDIIYLDSRNLYFKIPNSYYFNDVALREFRKYDIIHSHGLRPDLISFFLKLRYPGIKTISTIHIFIFEDLNFTLNSFLSKIIGGFWFIINAFKDRIVVLSNAQRDYYRKFHKHKNILVIRNGRTLNFANSANSELEKKIKIFKSSQKDRMIIGTTCVLNKLKGVDQAINVLKNFDDVSLIIVGDGPEMDNLKALSISLNIQERCLFTGFYEDNQVFFNSIDLFLLTSYSEASPLALIEASLHGVPSVCSKLETLKDLLPDHLICYYELNDLDDLKWTILRCKRLFDNKTEIRDYSLKNLSGKRMAYEYEELYNKVIQLIE